VFSPPGEPLDKGPNPRHQGKNCSRQSRTVRTVLGVQLASNAPRDCTAVHLVAPVKSCCCCIRFILKFMTTGCSNGEGRVIQYNFRYPQQHAPLTSIHPPCSMHLKKQNPSADLRNISDTVNGYALRRMRSSQHC
jgi:hypothetical protein